MIEINAYQEADREAVIALVLRCKNDGTRVIRLEDQPDLFRVREEYMDGGGNFWVAKEDGKVVGTIALMNKGGGVGVLKKFFVAEPYRGRPHHLGRRLYAVLLQFARERHFRQMVLDTPRNTERAHRFYEKAGFRQVEKEELAVEYDYPYADSDFFCLELQPPVRPE